MKLPKLPFQMMRRQFIGLGVLGIFILILQIFFYFQKKKKIETVRVEVVEEKVEKNIVLSDFNPNDLSEKEWQDLGFTKSQVKTILKYKEVVGGSFKSKEQLKKCYAISNKKFIEIEPYILLPQKENFTNYHSSFEKRKLRVVRRFNPDSYKLEDWVDIGFSDKQAAAILKYKNYLGGSFRSKEKFRECFVISSEDYRILAPYLILPEVVPESYEQNKNKSKIHYSIFNPNDLDIQGWKNLGFSEKQAKVILNYKERNLKGSFRSLDDVQKCFVISNEKFEELKPWINIQVNHRVNGDEAKSEEISSLSKTDFSKIDINTITFKQLIEFGFEEKSARSFMGFRKKLGGFVSKQQVLETYNIDVTLAKDLISVSVLDVSKVQKYSLKNAPESMLKTHPYFRKYADKILYYRISFPSDKEIFEKIKATSSEVAKMKLYLN